MEAKWKTIWWDVEVCNASHILASHYNSQAPCRDGRLFIGKGHPIVHSSDAADPTPYKKFSLQRPRDPKSPPELNQKKERQIHRLLLMSDE